MYKSLLGTVGKETIFEANITDSLLWWWCVACGCDPTPHHCSVMYQLHINRDSESVLKVVSMREAQDGSALNEILNLKWIPTVPKRHSLWWWNGRGGKIEVDCLGLGLFILKTTTLPRLPANIRSQLKSEVVICLGSCLLFFWILD